MQKFIQLVLLTVSSSIFACTDFGVPSVPEVAVTARTMDFATYFDSFIQQVPKGKEINTTLDSGEKGISWKNRYGFVGLNVFKKPIFPDGLNEAGLSAAMLWLPTSEYPEYNAKDERPALSHLDIPSWAMGNFRSVDEVKEALRDVQVVGEFLPQLGQIPTVHYVFHDETGETLVVEFIDGEMKTYDNPNQVLTNAPNLPWQLTNLTNYTALSNENAPMKMSGQTINGSGLMGIPGDMTPPSRFVRISYLRHFSPEAKNRSDAVTQALHLLSSVDIPRGEIKEGDYTQWSVVRDHTNKALYVRSYDNQTVRKVELSKLRYNYDKAVPVDIGPSYIEITGNLDKME